VNRAVRHRSVPTMPILTHATIYKSLSSWWLSNIDLGDTMFAVLVMWLSTEITFWSVNLFFYVIEVKGWFAKHKIHKESTDHEQFKSTLFHKPITYLVDVPIYWASFRLTGIFHEGVTGPHAELPCLSETALHVLICTVTFDLMFYMWHRSLHSRLLYPFHKKHHEVRITYACANDHEGVLEVTGNILWKMIPPAALGSHVYTVCIFRSLVKFFALLHHSGYELPVFQPIQKIPFISSPSHHDFHHYNNYGNYGGVFMIWDYLFGTFHTWDDKARGGLTQHKTMVNCLTQHEVVALAKKDYDELPLETLKKLVALKFQDDHEDEMVRTKSQALKVLQSSSVRLRNGLMVAADVGFD